MNITLSADAETIQKTRQLAQQRGTTLNGLLRDYMLSLTISRDPEESAKEFARNALSHSGESPADFRFDREEAHHRS